MAPPCFRVIPDKSSLRGTAVGWAWCGAEPQVVLSIAQVVLGAISSNLEVQITSHQAAEKMATLQGQMCGMLQVCMERLCRSDEARVALVPHTIRCVM